MIQVTPEQKMEVINHYQFTGELLSQEPYGSGHINDTFLLVYDIERMGRMKVILHKAGRAYGKCGWGYVLFERTDY